ncbi:MAG: thioredoxin domain-containing protein [Roseibacillus sp.]
MRLAFACTLAALCWGPLWMGGQAAEEAPRAGLLNRLAQSKSPYLLQHADNPVDWYPWGEEAFAKARKENKPILLSVGYSTCHWCHVMERESFENEEVAAFLNEHFVSIKLDREERPDVDRVYMTSFQAMFGEGGGWPLNMFLTPDLKPFYGGTYFPPEDRGGRPGFLTALTQLNTIWRKNPDEVLKSANDIHKRLSEVIRESQKLTEGAKLSKELLVGVPEKFLEGADKANGGWGRAQKFPQPSHLRFLMRSGGKGREFALMTCRKMMEGGIHDHIGGGFHRYTVDPVWLVPHFEKMLYDQAQLLDVYVEAWLHTKNPEFRQAAVGIAEYVLDQLRHKEGGFFSAQDAQSEDKEGKYWCWTEKELKAVLSEGQFKVAKRWFGFTGPGNFIDHSDPEHLKDQNVLFLADPRGEWSAAEKKELAGAIAKMREVRRKRVPPATDDKILASWNGLMIAALARAGRFLDEPRYLAAAKKALSFVQAKLWDAPSKTLHHRWRDNNVVKSQQAESYLYLIRGSRVLYEATLDKSCLTFAIDLANKARTLFYDEVNGSFFDGETRDDLVIRIKDDFDSATPTPSSVGRLEFAILAEMTGKEEFREVAEKSLRSAVPVLEKNPTALAETLRAVEFFVSKPARLVIVGGTTAEEFLKVAWSGLRNNLVVMSSDGPVSEFTASLTEKEKGQTTAYYCIGKTCRLPETDPKKLSAWLQEDPDAPTGDNTGATEGAADGEAGDGAEGAKDGKAALEGATGVAK